MKGGVLGYGLILGVLITGAFVIIYTTQAQPVTATVATTEGMLTSFGNFNHFFLRTFNQSIEFISQRSAYELGKNGGLLKGENLWNYYYPSMATLEKNLRKKIEKTLPSSYTKGKRIVMMDEIDIDLEPQLPLVGSNYFVVEGEANFSIYDESIRTRTFLHHDINSNVKSSYFKLLNAGRAILEDVNFNSSLDDANNLLLLLNNEPQFDDLDFDITVTGDILDISIEEVCYPSDIHCLAPLNLGELGVTDVTTGEQTHYDILKLNFKVEADQTGVTPPSCDFNIIIIPPFDDVEAGDSETTVVRVKKTGTVADTVFLTVDSIVNSTGDPDSTISVTFNPSNEEMTFNSIMTVETSSLTLADVYTITVRGDGCGGAVTKTATYTLTVNPSMTFVIVLNPNSGTVERGDSIQPLVDVHRLAGSDRVVDLFISNIVPDPLGGITATFSPELIPTDFISTMTINTIATMNQGIYTITVMGIGGGSTATDTFWLTVELPFSFDLSVTPVSDSIYPTQPSSETITVERITGIPEAVTIDLISIIDTATGLPDPGGDDYDISVSFGSSPCTPLGPVYECYPDMDISTTEYTPPGNYEIRINGSSSEFWTDVTFDLEVLTPECFPPDPSMCGAASTDCKYFSCVNFQCIENDYPDDYVPLGPDGTEGTADDPCGFEDCDGLCESGIEYKDPTSATCNIECDGAGSCDSSCDAGACAYNTIKTCNYGCKGTECWAGLWCEETRARCKICGTGWCYGDCEPSGGSDECSFCSSFSCGKLCVAGDRCYSEDGGPDPRPDVFCDVSCQCCIIFCWVGISKAVKDCSICEVGWPNKESGCSPAFDPDEMWCIDPVGGSWINGCWKVPCDISDACTYA